MMDINNWYKLYLMIWLYWLWYNIGINGLWSKNQFFWNKKKLQAWAIFRTQWIVGGMYVPQIETKLGEIINEIGYYANKRVWTLFSWQFCFFFEISHKKAKKICNFYIPSYKAILIKNSTWEIAPQNNIGKKKWGLEPTIDVIFI
jgi:hypothetical protein